MSDGAEEFSNLGVDNRTFMSHFRQNQLINCYLLCPIKQTLLMQMASCHILPNQTNTRTAEDRLIGATRMSTLR